MLLHKEIIQALNQCKIVINSFNGLKSVVNRNLLLNIQLFCVFLLDIKNITEQFLQSVGSLFYLMVIKGEKWTFFEELNKNKTKKKREKEIVCAFMFVRVCACVRVCVCVLVHER